jgi:hypothetical protein
MFDGYYEPSSLLVTPENEMFIGENSDFASICSLLYDHQEENQTYFQTEKKYLYK